MLLTNYKERLVGLSLITIRNEFSDGNDKKKSVLGTIKSQRLCAIA